MVIHMETLATKLPPGLVDGVDALIRRGDYPNRSEVLRAAVRRFLAMEAGAAPSPEARVFATRVEAYKTLMRRLGRDPRYRGRWVAVHKGEVLDDDGDMDTLVRRVLRRREHPVQIGLADPEGRLPVVRIPGVRVRVR